MLKSERQLDRRCDESTAASGRRNLPVMRSSGPMATKRWSFAEPEAVVLALIHGIEPSFSPLATPRVLKMGPIQKI